MSKTFDVAGTSSHKGVVKARFANGLEERMKMLTKAGHDAIALFQLPSPMTKEEAAKYLVAHGHVTSGSTEHAALTGKLDSIATKARRAEKRDAVKGEKEPKAKTAPAKTPVIAKKSATPPKKTATVPAKTAAAHA